MSYITITLNHMRSVKAWADAAGAEANLDLRTFELEVKARNRFYRFKPRFLGLREGRLFHSDKLVDLVFGFIGWLPYGILRWDLAEDKLVFKKFAESSGLRVPASWTPESAPKGFLLKRSVGSFGLQISGPYRAGTTSVTVPPPAQAENQGSLFAEQFVEGASLKVWYWGSKPFFAHRHEAPLVLCDGKRSLCSLVDERLAGVGDSLEASSERAVIETCLAYQRLSLSDVPPAGQTVWMDFRYGKTYKADRPQTAPDNDLDALPPDVREQVDKMGQAGAVHLHGLFNAPVLYAVDGICDATGQVWWLEMNSNPVLPPDGYAPMFASLFGAATKA